MSMQSGMGAASAAREIITLIKETEEKQDSERLELIKARCEEIEESGNAGWY